jgi:hypothetical protein
MIHKGGDNVMVKQPQHDVLSTFWYGQGDACGS